MQKRYQHQALAEAAAAAGTAFGAEQEIVVAEPARWPLRYLIAGVGILATLGFYLAF